MRQLYTVVPFMLFTPRIRYSNGRATGARDTVIPYDHLAFVHVRLQLNGYTTLRFVHDAHDLPHQLSTDLVEQRGGTGVYYYKGSWRPEKAGFLIIVNI